MGRRWFGRVAAVVTVGALLVGTAGSAASATGSNGWPVAAESFGVMYGATDPQAIGAVRAWEAGAWCVIQPSPDADMQAILAGTLGAQLDAHRATGATTAIVGLGFPPAWVYDNHPSTAKHVVQYGCGANAAAAVSIPAYATVKPTRSGQLPLQAQRWQAYVRAVISFIDARYGQSMHILLQVWNEPNLTSGLRVDTKVPGSARSVREAVNSLYELERITRGAVQAQANPAITLTSTALFQRPNDFFRLYLAKHARRPMVSSLAFNVYGAPTRTPDAMVEEWNDRVQRIRARVNKYAKLRRMPAIIGETTLNLVNNRRNKTNLGGRITDPAAQRRMATAVQMDAFFHGFRAVYWLAGPQAQTAMNVGYQVGTPGREALGVLRAQLGGRLIAGCHARGGVRTCTFRDPTGATAPVQVRWRAKGTSTVRASGPGVVVSMTGESTAVAKGARVRIGTTPVVLRPA